MLGNAARDFTVKSCVNDLGIPHGRTEMYRKPEGTLLGRGTQQNGFLEGKTEEFAEDGTTVIRIEMYHKGKMISYRDL